MRGGTVESTSEASVFDGLLFLYVEARGLHQETQRTLLPLLPSLLAPRSPPSLAPRSPPSLALAPRSPTSPSLALSPRSPPSPSLLPSLSSLSLSLGLAPPSPPSASLLSSVFHLYFSHALVFSLYVYMCVSIRV